MPEGLGMLSLRVRGFGDKFMHSVCKRYLYTPSGCLNEVAFFDFSGNQLGSVGMTEFSRALRNKFLMKVVNLKLDNNQIDDEDMVHFCRALSQGALPNVSMLSLDGNRIGDKGLAELIRVLKNKEVVPNLDRLMVSRQSPPPGVPATAYMLTEVNRALRQRGRGLKMSKAIAEAQSDEKASQRKAARVWEPAGVD